MLLRRSNQFEHIRELKFLLKKYLEFLEAEHQQDIAPINDLLGFYTIAVESGLDVETINQTIKAALEKKGLSHLIKKEVE